jgi:hypothetical protein
MKTQATDKFERLITAYYLCHGHWTVIPWQLRENFKEMADIGFNTVALSFSESEMVYSRRAFETQVTLAHQEGLRVLVIPSRLGGRFAGAPLMPSMWLTTHSHCQVPDISGWPLACLECDEFIEWITEFMITLVGDYEVDGIIWDEPKGLDTISRHQETLRKLGEPSREATITSFVEFLARLNSECLKVRPELVNTLFCQKTDPELFTAAAVRIPGIDFFGYDGNLARQSVFKEEPKWTKYRLESVWERAVQEAKSGGKRTFALVENMLMPKAAMGEYESNLSNYLSTHSPEHLALYYYAHNNEDAEGVHAITARCLKQHLER